MSNGSLYLEIAGSFPREKSVYLLLGAMAVLYALSMPSEYVIGDPYDELQLTTSGVPVLRSYHLLTTVLYRNAAFLLSWLPGTTMLHLELFMIAIALLTALGLYNIARQAGADSNAAVVVAGLFAVSDAFWFHGRTIETGMPALAALTWSISLGWTAYHEASASKRQDGTMIGVLNRWSVTLFSISVLLHLQTIVLLPALFLLWLPAKQGRDIRTLFLKFTALAGGLIGAAYLIAAVGLIGLQTPGQISNWLFTHGSTNTLAHLKPGLLSIPRALSGLLRLFTDFGGGGTALRGMLTGEDLANIDWQEGVALIIAIITVAAAALWTWRGRKAPHRGVLSAFAAFTALLVFNSFWLGSDPQFWLNLIPFVIPLIAVGIQSSRNPARWKLFAAALIQLLLTMNLRPFEPSVVFPNGDLANQQAKLWASDYPGSVIITPGSRWTSALVSMGANIEVNQFVKFKQDVVFFTVLDSLVADAMLKGKGVYIEGLEKIPSAMVGLWETVASLYQVRPSDVYDHLAGRYILQQLNPMPEAMSEIVVFRVTPLAQP